MSNWKRAERTVAALFNSKRVPLSGALYKNFSSETNADVQHKVLYIECKYRSESPYYRWLTQVLDGADPLSLAYVLVVGDSTPYVAGWLESLKTVAGNEPPYFRFFHFIGVERKRDWAYSLFTAEVVPAAKREGKVPLLCVRLKNKRKTAFFARRSDLEIICDNLGCFSERNLK